MKGKSCWMIALAIVIGMAASSTLLAQPAGGGQGGPGGGPGGPGGFGGGGFDPAQFRQMQLDNYRQALGSTDDEWKVLQPKIDKILDIQPLANAGGRGGFGFGRGRGGPGGPGGGRGFGGQPNPVQEKVAAVSTAVENNANDQELKQKLAAAREARDKARADLAKARKDLVDVLTTKQEAILFGMGLVE